MALDLYVSWSVYRWNFAMLSYLKTQTKTHSMIIHQFLEMSGERNVQQSWERRYVDELTDEQALWLASSHTQTGTCCHE